MADGKRAPLGSGQHYIWLRYQQLPEDVRHESHIVRRFEIPDGTTLPSVRALLNAVVRRHEALRTTYHFDCDADPYQLVHPPAALPLGVVTMEQDGTPGPGEALPALTTTAFRLDQEWPIRACVVTKGGVPRQLVLVLNHIAFDAWSVDRFEQELEAMREAIRAKRPAALRPVRHQPLDLARHESSAATGAARARDAAYWRTQLSRLPADGFAARRMPGRDDPAYGATLTSPHLLEVTRRIADRLHVWPSVVHLAAYTAVMAAYTGADDVAHLSFTGNRDEADYGDVMTCAFSPLLVDVDCADSPPFGELVRRVSARFEAAGVHAGLPYDELLRLLADESRTRGEVVRLGAELNFLSHAAQETRARRTTVTHHSAAAFEHYGADTLFRIYEMKDAVVIALTAASTVMDADVVQQFLRGYEAALLAHADPLVDLDLAAISRLVGFPAADGAGAVSHWPIPRQRTGLDDDSDALRALTEAVRQANGLPALDPHLDYTAAGGRVLRIPRVLALLAERGWEGLTVSWLASGAPLATLADGLTPRPERAAAASRPAPSRTS